MDSLLQEWGLWSLFVSAFIASTLFPGGSEILLLTLAAKGDHDPTHLWAVATTGNALGGMSSWLLGRILAWRFPVDHLNDPSYLRAVTRIQRWGSPLMLLSWVPVAGDPLCVAAGWLKINPWEAALFITVGKGLRYGALLAMI